jgi:hypothetical protein
MVQGDQAAAGCEDGEQLVVAFASRGRLNLRVGFFHSAFGQEAHSQVKEVALKPE